MAKKKPAPKIPPHRPEPEGGPFERQKAFVDERRQSLRPKQNDDEQPGTDTEGGTNCGQEEDDDET